MSSSMFPHCLNCKEIKDKFIGHYSSHHSSGLGHKLFLLDPSKGLCSLFHPSDLILLLFNP